MSYFNSLRMPQSTLISILKLILPDITLFQSNPSPLPSFEGKKPFRREALSCSPLRPGFDASGRRRAPRESQFPGRSPARIPPGTRLPPAPRGREGVGDSRGVPEGQSSLPRRRGAPSSAPPGAAGAAGYRGMPPSPVRLRCPRYRLDSLEPTA